MYSESYHATIVLPLTLTSERIHVRLMIVVVVQRRGLISTVYPFHVIQCCRMKPFNGGFFYINLSSRIQRKPLCEAYPGGWEIFLHYS